MTTRIASSRRRLIRRSRRCLVSLLNDAALSLGNIRGDSAKITRDCATLVIVDDYGVPAKRAI